MCDVPSWLVKVSPKSGFYILLGGVSTIPFYGKTMEFYIPLECNTEVLLGVYLCVTTKLCHKSPRSLCNKGLTMTGNDFI